MLNKDSRSPNLNWYLPNTKQESWTLDSDPCFIVLYIYIYMEEEDPFYQQIGLKFEEETNKMLHLEHGFVWC